MNRLPSLVAAVLLLGPACGCAPEGRGPAARTAGDAAVSPPDTYRRAPAGADPADWAVSARGAGPVRIGMRVAELAPSLNASVDTAAIGEECAYLSVAGAPDGVEVMVVGGRVVRIDVHGGATPTTEGARIGDPEARIRALYPGLRERPHEYTAGRYLIALPGAPGDTLHRLVFETDGERVTRFRGGLFPPVEYVEGCS